MFSQLKFDAKGMWGNFITEGNPSITDAIANGISTTSAVQPKNPASSWPPFSIDAPYQLNLNESGGVPLTMTSLGVNVTEYEGPGLRNNFTLVDAYTWEGGRGYRCDFWRSMGLSVPEK